MDKAKQNLIGSPARDLFKQAHKLHAPAYCYACDLDFILITKKPTARIVAFLDYKGMFDDVSFSEVIAYNSLMSIAPVYIVRGKDPQLGPFDIQEYRGGFWQPEPPMVNLKHLYHCDNWNDLVAFELSLRDKEMKDANNSREGL